MGHGFRLCPFCPGSCCRKPEWPAQKQKVMFSEADVFSVIHPHLFLWPQQPGPGLQA